MERKKTGVFSVRWTQCGVNYKFPWMDSAKVQFSEFEREFICRMGSANSTLCGIRCEGSHLI